MHPCMARFVVAQGSSCLGSTRTQTHSWYFPFTEFIWSLGKYSEAKHCGHETGKAFFIVVRQVCTMKKMASVTKQQPINCITLILKMQWFKSVTEANRNFCFAPDHLGNPTFMEGMRTFLCHILFLRLINSKIDFMCQGLSICISITDLGGFLGFPGYKGLVFSVKYSGEKYLQAEVERRSLKINLTTRSFIPTVKFLGDCLCFHT